MKIPQSGEALLEGRKNDGAERTCGWVGVSIADFWRGMAVGSPLILCHSCGAWMISSVLSERNNLHP